MLSRESLNHHNDCYFYMVNIKGFCRCKKKEWGHPDLKSARRPVLHYESISMDAFTSLLQFHDLDSEESHALECS